MKQKFRLIIALLIVSTDFLMAQKNIKGIIVDSNNGEYLIGVVVFNSDQQKVILSNNYGYFSFPCLHDSMHLEFRYVGYDTKKVSLSFSDSVQTIKLSPKSTLIEDVVITAHNDKNTALGQYFLTKMDLKNTPVLMAEKDVLKSIQMLPGIQPNREGTSNFSVRGGGQDQNLILIDGIPVYNINHLFGFVSVFNTDATNKVTFYKGGIPAHFGGRLSSVTDVMLREGNREHFTGSVSLGILSSKFTFEGPLQKNKSSFLISGRRSIFDLFSSSYTYLTDNSMNGYHFQDYTLKLNYKITTNNTIYVSAYTGNDKVYTYDEKKLLGSTEKFNLGWSNITSAFRWNNTALKNLFSNLTIAYTYFNYLTFTESSQEPKDGLEKSYNYKGFNSGINDLIIRWDLSFYKFEHHQLNFGAEQVWHAFNPGMTEKTTSYSNYDIARNIKGKKSYGQETNTFIEDAFLFGNFNANIGLRISIFETGEKLYNDLQPRISAEYRFDNNISFIGGYDKMFQYLHLVSNTNIGMPTDLWLPITKNIPPQSSEQLSGGLRYKMKNSNQISCEVFYKNMKNLTDYKDGIVINNQNNNWDQILARGTGESYGIELMFEKQIGKFTGWANYSISKSLRKFAEINDGKSFPFQYDRRHVINILVNFKLDENKAINASWVGTNGYWMSISYDNYYVNGQFVQNFKDRNNYQVPFYHHLDISYRSSKQKKHGTRNWIFGVYNVYAHNNYFSVQYRYDDKEKQKQPKLFGIGLFPTIPFIAYEFVFK